ncbi:GNAT family N-acetyltransferase [Streptomyces sp. SID5785]|uniref:GNAT family N-acetyltransferase n=1 Tax=Streptomyces sp. SID5785 TaxID=2690309 RepID=UPI00136171F1|nr:GNAT family N-acetyltransferase [Streptomyces sp. SID5785]MZD06228.1 GNAT family N-acetyltransferase [Streptomyces sp. SID5785]
MRTAPRPDWTVSAEPYDSPAAVALWRAYYTEVSDRWYQRYESRDTDPAELEREIAADPGDHLAPPGGRLLVGRYRGEPAGMAGVWLADPGTAELTRVYVRGDLRGTGGAALLVAAAEDAARTLGAELLRLDTRTDLVEARALYARLGYTETEAFSDRLYAEHWFSKDLTAGPAELTPPDRSASRRAGAPRPSRTSPR